MSNSVALEKTRLSILACYALLVPVTGCGEEASEVATRTNPTEPANGSAPAGTQPAEDTDQAGRPAPAAANKKPQDLPYFFRDITKSSGLVAFQQVNGGRNKEFIVESVGGGVALFDYDLDGDLDAYLTNGGNVEGFPEGQEPTDALFANQGDARFTDVTDAAGLGDRLWTNGVTVIDIDHDGFPDLYLTNLGPNVLLRNRGDGTFEDITEKSGLGDPGWSTGSTFFDFDQDGDLDLYVTNYIALTREEMLASRSTQEYDGFTVFRGPRGLPEAHDTFYINDGDGVFRDASEEVGIRTKAHFGFQSLAFDYDDDGWMDLYVANDSVPNVLWHNNQKGGFEDRALEAGVAVSMWGKDQAGMGLALGDYDGDLRSDIYVTNFSHDYCTLYRGVAGSSFVDATYRLKLVESTALEISWGCGFEDFDNDGDQEIYVVNGHIYPQVGRLTTDQTYRQTNYLFEFHKQTFRLPEGGGGPGFRVKRVSRGSATGDIDGDGDLDLLIGNIDDSPTLLRNVGRTGNWIQLQLSSPGKNIDAIGARVVVHVGDKQHLRLVHSSTSFLSTSDRRIHIGLGDATVVDLVEVTWPDRSRERFTNLAAGGTVRIEQGTGTPAE